MPRPVQNSLELKRILALPTRKWEELDLEELIQLLNVKLKTPHGTMRLRQIQAAALKELYEQGGLFGPIPVGYGKSLIAYLAPVLMNAKRPLLLIPAKLKEKTKRELIEYGQHYYMHHNLSVMSYELLSRPRGLREFLELQPDMIIADESHRLKNGKAACTKRIKSWVRQRPETVFVALSGTITRKSIMDYQHIISWCLKENSPLPAGWRDAKEWALALDEEISFTDYRMSPGALLRMCTPEEIATTMRKEAKEIDIARIGYGRRLTSSPGVVSTSEKKESCSLLIKTEYFKQDKEILQHFKNLRETWKTPNGADIIDAPAFWRCARELANGFYYKWETPAPKAWLEARAEWASFARGIIKRNRSGIDTEFMVRNAVVRGEYKRDIMDNWDKVRPSFDPKTVPVWLSDNTLNVVKKLVSNNIYIVWVEHIAMGNRLSEALGVPYFAGQGTDSAGNYIEDAKGTIIASIAANGEGRNLQKWDRNLIVSCSPSAAILEQLIGRTHRTGQTSDEVNVQYLIGCIESYEGLLDIIRQSEYIRKTTGQEQKILYADKDFIDPSKVEDLIRRGDHAWKK